MVTLRRVSYIDTQMKEVWKTIKGQKGRYEISNRGRARRLPIFFERKTKVPIQRGYYREQITSGGRTSHGYRLLRIINGRNDYIHRFVAEAFIPNPEKKKCINHKNGIKDDNRVENIEWATHSENNEHAYRTGLKIPYRKHA